MISIIICSRQKELSAQLKNNIQNTIGTEYEIIKVDNSQNEYFITQAYNKGMDASKFDYLCFIHEDVEFKSQDWGKILISHLNNNPKGIIGLAGGQIATQVPSSWSVIAQTQRKNFMQCGAMISYPSNIGKSEDEVVMLDGFFLSCKKEFMKSVRFDDSLRGFHAYDADICFRSKANGGTNLVIYDLLVDHKSHGTPNLQWVECTKSVFQKWNHILPIYVGQEQVDINKIEKKSMLRFIRKMIKLGCSYPDIVEDPFISSLWKEVNRRTSFSLKITTLYYCLFKWIL